MPSSSWPTLSRKWCSTVSKQENKDNCMKLKTQPLRNFINRLPLMPTVLLIVLACACFALSLTPIAFAVTPAPDGGYPNNNTAEGDSALLKLSSGTDNTAIGFGALFSNTTGNRNTAIGSSALDSSMSASDNTATGFPALAINSTGPDNDANGSRALSSNT